MTWKRVLPRAGAILLAVGITLTIFLLRKQIAGFAHYGLPGVFVISLLGNATVILPAPSLAVVFAMGSVLPPIHVGLVAGVGEALGELTGYLAGYAGSVVIEDRARYERIHQAMQRYGMLPILILSMIPNPIFDLAGMAAGALRLPIWQFLLACWAGKTIKTVAVAFAGAGSAAFLETVIERLLH